MTKTIWGILALLAMTGFIVVIVVWALAEIGALARKTREEVVSKNDHQ